MYKLDAELDHFDIIGNEVEYKDLLVANLTETSQLPATVRERVGV